VASPGALVGLIAVGMLVDPSRPLPFELCLWQRLFDLDCLTCGLTRAVCSALQGDLAASWAYHPAGVFVAAGLIFEAGSRLSDAARQPSPPPIQA
jgi:hypothetical protein